MCTLKHNSRRGDKPLLFETSVNDTSRLAYLPVIYAQYSVYCSYHCIFCQGRHTFLDWSLDMHVLYENLLSGESWIPLMSLDEVTVLRRL